jgi:tetratricopeptide (TPR) repeat protein
MRSALLLALSWIALPSAAFAQSDDSIDRARPHFVAAQQYYEDGEYAAALREFRRAHELTSQPEILYNIALCYERLGDFPNAVSSLEQYLATEQEVAERAGAEERLARLRQTIAQRDELETPSAPATETAPVVAPVEEESEPLPVVPIAVLSVAGVTLIAGVILGSLAITTHDSLARDCGAAGCSDGQIAELNALTISADVSFGVSLAAAVAGLVLALVLPEENRAPSGIAWRFQ